MPPRKHSNSSKRSRQAPPATNPTSSPEADPNNPLETLTTGTSDPSHPEPSAPPPADPPTLTTPAPTALPIEPTIITTTATPGSPSASPSHPFPPQLDSPTPADPTPGNRPESEASFSTPFSGLFTPPPHHPSSTPYDTTGPPTFPISPSSSFTFDATPSASPSPAPLPQAPPGPPSSPPTPPPPPTLNPLHHPPAPPPILAACPPPAITILPSAPPEPSSPSYAPPHSIYQSLPVGGPSPLASPMAAPPSPPPNANYFPGTRTYSPKHPPIGGPPPMPPGYAYPPGYPAADVEAGYGFMPAAQGALVRDELAAPLLHPASAFPGGPGGSMEDYLKHQRRVRHGFLRKVFGLLTVTLLITTATTALFRLHPPIARYTLSHPWTLWLATAGTFATILALAFSHTLRRTHPYNLLALLTFTVLESLLVATASAAFRTDILLLAAGITAATTALLTAFALQTKYDLTASAGLLLGCLTAVLVATFVNVFWQAPGFTIATAGLSAVVFSVYIVYDVQLVVGGEHLYGLSEDEYVFATLNLYLDIVNLFLALLRLLDYTSGGQGN